MMRYQRVSPDYLPLTNGRKPGGGGLRATCKEGNESPENGRIPTFLSPSSLEAKSFRARSTKDSPQNFSPEPTPPPAAAHYDFNASASPAHKSATNHHDISNGVARDVLLQWGHNKRSRGSRSESRYAAAATGITAGGDDAGSHPRQVIKIQRRAAAAAVMPPPPCGSYTRGGNLRPCTPARDSSGPLLRSAAEERSSGQSRSEKRGHPFSPPEKSQKMVPTANGFGSSDATASAKTDSKPSSEHESGGAATGNGGGCAAEKLNLEQFEWPRIFISLSRKEKEDDFLAMKGTKLPQRPKKRAKNIDKTLQYCFPGMWLSDLNRGRYEVREKKCVKKQKRRGLKGMESMDSDSE